jgi:MFS family permease
MPAVPAEPAAPDTIPARSELFGPGRRATTVGLLLLTLVIAFEAMGVGTALPAVIADLGAVSSYAWPIATFLAASVLGTVLGGRFSDVRGPRLPLLLTPMLFGIGLVVAGTATGLPQLLAGRVLQGLSAGAQMIAAMVTIAVVYPERARPALFGLMSGAWVLPSLVGPPLAGFVTERLSWHWVFLGLVPVVAVALALVVPAARRLDPPEHPAPGRPGLVAAAAGAALGVSALSWAAQRPGLLGAAVAVVALAALVPSLRRLLPAGTFRSRRGVPAVVAARGLLAGVFFTVNSYVPLMLTATHGWSLTMAGLPLVTASLGWTTSSAWQGRHPDLSRAVLLRTGFCLVTVGIVGLAPVTAGWGAPWLALPSWTVAGLGMGVGFSAVSFLLLRHSAEGEVGAHSAAAQLADQLTTAALVGLGGALLALTPPPSTALTVLLVPVATLAVLGALLAPRTA